ncbi:potassium channel family protein [Marinobacter arenosus]|uniref:potassium channel family protein n=1 Tax=Marinobacter arenosus TaxID=2856822 RepID=UPI001C4A984E|nr:potassium channel family protein [Marinobacter arenosus]MBW0146222.1 potassium channel family protein [Marinobacter arenosus]
MISFWISGYRLLKTVWRGLRQDAEFRVMVFVLATVLLSGTGFYHTVEGWSLIDSLYFCVMLMATIGLSDLAPTTDVSKLFTILYAILTIGLFIALCSKLVMFTVSANLKAAESISRKLSARSEKHKEPPHDE